MLLSNTFLELAGICVIGTIIFLAIFFIVEIGKESMHNILEDDEEDKNKQDNYKKIEKL